jgi:ribosomal-protein-serine acetyltransferase
MIKAELKFIKKDEYSDLLLLFSHNLDRLLDYFPVSSKKITTIDAAKEYLKDLSDKFSKKELYGFGVYFQSSLIGMLYIKNIDWSVPECEIGYFMDQSHQGKGIMSGILKSAVEYYFIKLRMVKIFLRIGPENKGSQRVAEKNGFRQEGVLRKAFRTGSGELVDVEYYGKLN